MYIVFMTIVADIDNFILEFANNTHLHRNVLKITVEFDS